MSIKPSSWMTNPFTPVKNYINHIALVLDASGSMQHLRADVVKVADSEIRHLAAESQRLDQETRITIYTFSDPTAIQCLVYDKDVLRLPSIATLYSIGGNTALIDATSNAIRELKQTATLHGDHSFLIYVLTDGEENRSVGTAAALESTIKTLPENWTLAAFVPHAAARAQALRFGFPADNVAIWSGDAKGMQDVGATVRAATSSYMTGRALGVRGTKNLFHMDQTSLNTTMVKAKLDELHFGQYRLFSVPTDCRIDEFVEAMTKRAYKLGEAYYELMKPETIQATKNIVIKHRQTHKLYQGANARDLLKLPPYDVRCAPEDNKDWQVFVQSTSVNRKLIGGTSLVVLS